MSSLARLVMAPDYRYIEYLGNLIGSICDRETCSLGKYSSCMFAPSKRPDMHSHARNMRATIVYDGERLMCRYQFLLCGACFFIVSVASTPRFLPVQTQGLRLIQDPHTALYSVSLRGVRFSVSSCGKEGKQGYRAKSSLPHSSLLHNLRPLYSTAKGSPNATVQ